MLWSGRFESEFHRVHMLGADLVVTPYKTDDYSILFASLHAVHRADLELGTIFGTQQRTKEGDLGLIPISRTSWSIDKWRKISLSLVRTA